MTAALLVGIGGFAGAVARQLVDRRFARLTGDAFPWATFVINVSGSFMVGVLFALIVERASLNPQLRAPLMIGFLGAYTTFSTLVLESWRLVEEGAWQMALANVGGSVVLGTVAVVAGLAVGRAV